MTYQTTDSGVLQDDLRELLQLLGMSDAAQPRSPHEVFQSALQELRRILSPAHAGEAKSSGGMENCVALSEAKQPTPRSSIKAVEIRTDMGGAVDEIFAKGCTVHIEQLSHEGWFMGIDASDGSYWQFWFGAKNRRAHVEIRHTETVSAEETMAWAGQPPAAPIEPQVPVAHANEPEHALGGDAKSSGGWPSEEEIARVLEDTLVATSTDGFICVSSDSITKAAKAIASLPRPQGWEEAIEAAAKCAEQEVTTYQEGMSAVDVRLSETRGPKWREGREIAKAIRSLPPPEPAVSGGSGEEAERAERERGWDKHQYIGKDA
jgi:hypothetical protein